MDVPPRPILNHAAAARWHPGAAGALHNEVFASSQDGSGAGLALALARDALTNSTRDALMNGARDGEAPAQAKAEDCRSVLWVQDRAAIRLNGRPFRAGLPEWLQGRLIHVAAGTPEDALFALEEGLQCRDLACVIGEMAGNPRALSFTASRRLTLAAERHGVPLWLIRLDAARDLSSARMRWEAAAAPSAPPQWDARAPGRPAWRAALLRARNHPPGEWILDDDGHSLAVRPNAKHAAHAPAASRTPYPVGLAFASAARSVAAG